MPKMVGRVRGLRAGLYPENREDEQFHLNMLGDATIADGVPERAEIVRHGDSYNVCSAAWTGLTAIPTTVMIQRLWNGEPDTGLSYVIDSIIIVKIIIDVTTNDQFSVFAQLVRPPVAAITDAGAAIVSMSGRPNYSGRARKDTGTASSAVSGRWDMIGNSNGAPAAIAGSAWQSREIPLYGKYIVPPGGSFGIHVAEVTATASTFRSVIRWHEVRLPIVS